MWYILHDMIIGYQSSNRDLVLMTRSRDLPKKSQSMSAIVHELENQDNNITLICNISLPYKCSQLCLQ